MGSKNEHYNSTKEIVSLESCTFAKTILMICVVIYHSMALWTNVWAVAKPKIDSPTLSFFALWLNSFHVYGFVVISGYLFYYLRHDKHKYYIFADFISQKAKRLVVPAITVSIIWCIPFALFFFSYDWRTIIVNYIFAVSPNQLWFLWMLFWVFLLSWLLFDFIEKHSLLSFLFSVVLYWIGVFASTKIQNYFQIWTACQFFVYFWFGIKLRQKGTKWIKSSYIFISVILHITLFCIDQYYVANDGIANSIVHYSIKPIVHILGGILIFIILSWLSTKISWKESKIFKIVSKTSMPIFLFHQQVIYVCVYLLNGKVYPIINAIVNFIVSFVVSIAISLLCLRFNKLRLIIGEK
jgi:Acyltransferase family.